MLPAQGDAVQDAGTTGYSSYNTVWGSGLRVLRSSGGVLKTGNCHQQGAETRPNALAICTIRGSSPGNLMLDLQSCPLTLSIPEP